MANTTKLRNRTLEIKGLDADWSIAGDLAGMKKAGLRIKSITFYPSAANDIFIIKEGLANAASTAAMVANTVTDPRKFSRKAITADAVVQEYGDHGGQQSWPYIDISDCTLNTAANARIEIEIM